MHCGGHHGKTDQCRETLDFYNVRYAINFLDVELQSGLASIGVDCLDLRLEKNDSEFMVEYLRKCGDDILSVFDYSFDSHKSLFIFCDSSYTHSLTLVLYFFFRR